MTATFDVRISVAAERDIQSIYDYVFVHGSPGIAETLLRKILERIDGLEQFPGRGAPVPELELVRQDYRQFLLTPYRCIYKIDGTIVTMIAVLDGRRDIGDVLRRRFLQPSG